MSKKIKLKILKQLKDYKVGTIIPIEVNDNGTALDMYWRNRINDSSIDKCVEIMEHKEDKKKSKTGSNSK